MNKKLILLLIEIGAAILIVLVMLFQKNPPLTDWKCILDTNASTNGSYVAARLDKDGNVQCITNDIEGVNCYWVDVDKQGDQDAKDTAKNTCEENKNKALNNIIPNGILTCGIDEYAKKHPNDDQTKNFCAVLKDINLWKN